ncbi:MAG: hypothetical protein K2Q23_14985, partial [Bryobacteraceae bacterium]|nr:hypothetical protein [Bryobacteraceae bacterium]
MWLILRRIFCPAFWATGGLRDAWLLKVTRMPVQTIFENLEVSCYKNRWGNVRAVARPCYHDAMSKVLITGCSSGIGL